MGISPLMAFAWLALAPASPHVPPPTGLAGWLASYGAIGGLAGAVLAFLVAIRTHLWPSLSAFMKRRSIERQDGARLIPTDGIERAMRFFVDPLFMDVDPAGEDDLRAVVGAQQRLFEVLDHRLRHPGKHRYLMLLADSGMGKTSALLNYYARHLRRWRKRFDLVVVPLGDPRCDQVIAEVSSKSRTSIFLDALDEDPRAIANLRERLDQIIEATRDFRSVLISCRTQFFAADIEMPRETGVLRPGPTPAGDDKRYKFYKMYLAPFSQRQIDKFLRLRYPFWRWTRRRSARRLMATLADLSARPLILSHADDILAANSAVTSLGGVYQIIVDAWLHREAAFVASDQLLQFSQRLAVDLVANRADRGGERIPGSELSELANQWDIPLESWQLGGRSLLNRDAAGSFKFAHRSIMEYLFAVRVTDFDLVSLRVEWTDLIDHFVCEFLSNSREGVGLHRFEFNRLSDRQVAEALLARLCEALKRSGWFGDRGGRQGPFRQFASVDAVPRSFLDLAALLCYQDGCGALLLVGFQRQAILGRRSAAPLVNGFPIVVDLADDDRFVALFKLRTLRPEHLGQYAHICELLCEEGLPGFVVGADFSSETSLLTALSALNLPASAP